MATPMSSAFTGAERRKKLVTYGRAARLSSTQIFTEDAPSSERPRKHRPRATARAATAVELPLIRQNRSPAPRDEFDVPSDNEPTPRAVPLKKSLPTPPPKPVEDPNVFDVPSSGDERRTTKHENKKPVQPSRRANATRPRVPGQQTKALEKRQAITIPSDDPRTAATSATRTRAKSPLAAPKPAQAKSAKQGAQASKVASRPTAPAAQVVIKQKKAKPVPASLVKKTVPTPPIEPASDIDVFEVPSSDEDAPTQTPIRPRQAPTSRVKPQHKPSTSRALLSPEPSAESDASDASHKRKRHGSVSSLTNVTRTDDIQRKREASAPRRSRKYPRTEDSISPGHTANEHPQSTLVAVMQNAPINKPNRTRTRTVPVISRPPIVKTQSSPVKLHDMLVMRLATKPSPVQETRKPLVAEDETMYDIQEEATPLVRAPESTIPGSVTPRQRDLFSNLLGDSSESVTPMPSISKLRLTGRRPGSAIGALTRSSSDIPQSAHTRKGRLLDMLKRAAPSSDGDSESDQESESGIAEMLAASAVRHVASQEAAEEMEIDPPTQTSSKASRAAIPIPDGPRLTYAKQRSYLEESNIEEGLLNWDEDIDVDLDDRQGSVTGSEDDSQQVTGLPELRRKGQLYRFEVETLAMIEDISGKSNMNISGRRSAMMEFASQMADESYVEQLLESAMTSSLLRAVSAIGDMIFDFAAAAAILFMLKTKPSYAVIDHIYRSDILSTLRKLLSSTMSSFDIHRISKDRKTNMAASARETVAEFRTLVLKTCDWPADDVPKLSPQLIAIKLLEELVIGLRTPGNTEAIVDEGIISKVLDAASGSSQRLQSGKSTAQDHLILDTTFSALESLSISKEGQATWSNEILRRLAEMMTTFFETSRASPIRLVIRLCMNLTNSRPKACQIFADETFVTRLTRFIIQCFRLFGDDVGQEQTAGVREDLILGLGAMINLAEFSDQARLSVLQGGDELIGELVRIFLEGSERADRADSVEETQSSVAIGYLSILLGNLCLNDRVRREATSLLPGNNINLLVQKVKEFVHYNQRLDHYTNEFEGAEGQQTLKNFTLRLMLVVERLEMANV